MNNFLEFAAMAGAVAVSLGAAFVLEWLGLRGLMRLMPVASQPQLREQDRRGENKA